MESVSNAVEEPPRQPRHRCPSKVARDAARLAEFRIRRHLNPPLDDTEAETMAVSLSVTQVLDDVETPFCAPTPAPVPAATPNNVGQMRGLNQRAINFLRSIFRSLCCVPPGRDNRSGSINLGFIQDYPTSMTVPPLFDAAPVIGPMKLVTFDYNKLEDSMRLSRLEERQNLVAALRVLVRELHPFGQRVAFPHPLAADLMALASSGLPINVPELHELTKKAFFRRGLILDLDAVTRDFTLAHGRVFMDPRKPYPDCYHTSRFS